MKDWFILVVYSVNYRNVYRWKVTIIKWLFKIKNLIKWVI